MLNASLQGWPIVDAGPQSSARKFIHNNAH